VFGLQAGFEENRANLSSMNVVNNNILDELNANAGGAAGFKAIHDGYLKRHNEYVKRIEEMNQYTQQVKSVIKALMGAQDAYLQALNHLQEDTVGGVTVRAMRLNEQWNLTKIYVAKINAKNKEFFDVQRIFLSN
jgi:hypothetical protein